MYKRKITEDIVLDIDHKSHWNENNQRKGTEQILKTNIQGNFDFKIWKFITKEHTCIL